MISKKKKDKPNVPTKKSIFRRFGLSYGLIFGSLPLLYVAKKNHINIFIKNIFCKLQSTIDDIIHMYSGPVRLILLACLTIIDAIVLI